MNVERKSAPTSKSRALQRSIMLLRALASPRGQGLALVELTQITGLPHSTVLRLIRQLCEEGLVLDKRHERRYVLGPLAFELGLAAGNQFDIRSLSAHAMDTLLRATQDTCYLILRSGTEAVCVDRREGTSSIRVITLHIGSRRPLGVGAAGLAILSSLPENEIERTVESIEERLQSFNRLTVKNLYTDIADTRERGYAVSGNRVTLGVTGIGVAINDANGRAYAAISVATVNQRMPKERWSKVAKLLQKQARHIEGSMRRPSLSSIS